MPKIHRINIDLGCIPSDNTMYVFLHYYVYILACNDNSTCNSAAISNSYCSVDKCVCGLTYKMSTAETNKFGSCVAKSKYVPCCCFFVTIMIGWSDHMKLKHIDSCF